MAMDPIRARILRLAEERHTNLAALSRAVGRNHAYFQQFVRRGTPRRLPEEVRYALHEKFGVPLHELGERAVISIKPFFERLIQFGGDDYGAIPVYEARAAAGAGAESEDAVTHKLRRSACRGCAASPTRLSTSSQSFSWTAIPWSPR
jgi:hypothetical protein